MIATTREAYWRTRQRLEEADQAVQAGQYTVAVILLRVALDSASREAFGKPCDQKAFSEMAALLAGGSRETLRRIRRLRDSANMVVHGIRNGHEREARQMLRLFRAVGQRWLRRIANADQAARRDRRGWTTEADAPAELVRLPR